MIGRPDRDSATDPLAAMGDPDDVEAPESELEAEEDVLSDEESR